MTNCPQIWVHGNSKRWCRYIWTECCWGYCWPEKLGKARLLGVGESLVLQNHFCVCVCVVCVALPKELVMPSCWWTVLQPTPSRSVPFVLHSHCCSATPYVKKCCYHYYHYRCTITTTPLLLPLLPPPLPWYFRFCLTGPFSRDLLHIRMFPHWSSTQ